MELVPLPPVRYHANPVHVMPLADIFATVIPVHVCPSVEYATFVESEFVPTAIQVEPFQATSYA